MDCCLAVGFCIHACGLYFQFLWWRAFVFKSSVVPRKVFRAQNAHFCVCLVFGELGQPCSSPLFPTGGVGYLDVLASRYKVQGNGLGVTSCRLLATPATTSSDSTSSLPSLPCWTRILLLFAPISHIQLVNRYHLHSGRNHAVLHNMQLHRITWAEYLADPTTENMEMCAGIAC